MSTRTPVSVIRPPSAVQIALSILLLILFAPVVLAVGSADFRPAWLLHLLGGVPLSTLWVLGSIILFIGLTWFFSRMAFARGEEARGQ